MTQPKNPFVPGANQPEMPSVSPVQTMVHQYRNDTIPADDIADHFNGLAAEGWEVVSLVWDKDIGPEADTVLGQEVREGRWLVVMRRPTKVRMHGIPIEYDKRTLPPMRPPQNAGGGPRRPGQ